MRMNVPKLFTSAAVALLAAACQDVSTAPPSPQDRRRGASLARS